MANIHQIRHWETLKGKVIRQNGRDKEENRFLSDETKGGDDMITWSRDFLPYFCRVMIAVMEL